MADATLLLGPYGAKTKRAFYEGLYTGLKTERSSFDSHWLDIANYLKPRRIRFQTSGRNRGDKRNQNILDNTGTMALRTLQSGLHSGLTSPARPWFKLGTPNADLARRGPVRTWLYEVTERMRTVFSQSNLYNALPIVYGDLGTFAVGAMAVLPDTKDLMRVTTFPIGSYVVAQDYRGLVAVFMHEYERSVLQVVEEFGGPDGQPATPGAPIDWSNISNATKMLYEQGAYEATVQILWVVAPNRDHRPDSPFARHFKYTSCYIERGAGGTARATTPGALTGDEGRKLLRESGFRTMPILAPRWDITSEDSYGIDCPGMTVLGDVRQLQTMQRKKAQAIAKSVDPPLVGPSALRTQKTSLLPGDVTYVDSREGMQGLRAIHEIGLNLEHLLFDIQNTQYRIQRGCYEDLFLMLQQTDPLKGRQPVTAREIEERHEEKLLALGPVLERVNDELLDPLIDRTYSMMEDADILPEIPHELDQVQLKVEYVSIMAQAQKLVGVLSQDRFLQTVISIGQGFAQSDPRVVAKININQLLDNYAEMLGVDPNAIRTNDEADEIIEGQQREQAAAVQAQVARDAAQAGKLASETRVGQGGTALDELAAVAGR